ncbi:MAG: Wzz/FepE/Etk N-terminal domain-containing protein, partial [Actinomycetota bacterium]|nr:Wzz/FepE/Etk N-terminal domain-containing protein [Actinomycetota bacterium]
MTLDISQQFPPSDVVDEMPLDLGRPATGSPFVAIPFLASALRRRRRLVAAAGAAGILLASLFSFVAQPAYKATTTILLVHGSEAVTTRAMATDLGLLMTTTVAQQALKALPERSSPQTLLAAYAGVPVSDDLLRVTAEGSSGAQAVRRTDAVAKAFIDFRAQEFQRQAQLAAKSLAERQGLLTAELTDVNKQINNTPSDQRSDAAIRAFGELLTRRTSLNDQITSLQQQIDLQNRDAQAIVDQTRVVDPASPDPRATHRTVAGNLAAGLIGGMALGVGFVIVQAITSDRVRRRDEISAALGAPVGVSVGRVRGGARRSHRRLTAHVARPDGDLARLERHLESCLDATGSVRPSMLVLSLDTDLVAATAVG